MSEARIVITANADKAVSEVDRLKGAFSNGMKSVEGSAGLATKAIGLLAAGGLALTFINSIKQAIDLADSLNKLSQRTGVATEALSQLQYAAKLADVSSESLTTGFKKLNVSIANGLAGDKEKLAVFEALGITLTDTAGRTKSADQVLLDMADTFAKSKDGAGKTAAAVALLGKAGDEMIPLLNGGSAAILALMKEADKLGLTISTEFGQRAEEFNDNLFRLKSSSNKLAIALGADLVESLGDVIKKMAEATIEGGKLRGIMAGIDAIGNNLFDWEGNAQRKTIKILSDDIAALNVQLNAPVVDIFGKKGQIQIELDEKIKLLAKARQDYFRLTDGSAGGGRGIINPKLVPLANLNGEKPEIKVRNTVTEKKEIIDPQIKAYESLVASIREKIDINNEEIALGRKLTESEKQVFDVQKLVAKGSIASADASSDKTKAMLHELAVSEQLLESKNANLALEKALRDEKYQLVDAMEKANSTSLEQNKTLADEIAMIGLSNQAQHDLTQARLQDVIGIKEQALARLQNTEFMSREQIAMEQEISLLKEKAALQNKKFERTEEADKLTELARQSKQFTDDLERGLTDSLFRAFESGKGFFKTLWDGIKNMFKTTVLKMVIQGVVGGTMSSLGLSAANAATGGGGSAGAVMSSIGIVDTVSKAYAAVTGGFAAMGNSVAFAAQDIGAWLQANTTGALNKAGTSLMQGSGALGTAAGYAAGAAAGIVLGRAISGEFSAFGSNKNTAVVIGTAIGAIWGPLGAAIGGAIGGLVNRAFGMGQQKTSATGITGSFSESGANIQNFQDWNQKGGWFRSDKSGTNYSGMDGGANDAINKALIMTSGALRTYAAMIGLSADAVNGFSQAIRINLMGLSAADAEKSVLNAIGNFGEAMATSAYGAALQSFKLANETTTATLSRLATDLTSVNTAFKNMGITLMAASLAGADASSKLIAMAGGLEKFTSQTNAYYTAFYSQAERTANVTRQLSEALGAMGLGMPSTRDGFRALVEAQNLMTDAGRTTYSVLLALAPAFAEISTAVEGSIAGLSEAMRKLQGDTASLQIELMRAGGNTTGADAAQRTIDTTGLNAAELAVFDYNASLRLQVTSLTSAAAAIKLMASSATGLRSAVSTARIGQLNPVQSLAQQQGDFASSYSMALSTTGTTQASYADRLTAALPGLSAALMDASKTREEWAISTASLFAQSETIAQQLDASSKSAERIIADAVTAGSESTANGLRAVVAALTGNAIPAFAAGGDFGGGLRIVGENGPELEATGPSRIFNAAQTRSMLSGGGDSTELLQELRALRAEVQGLRSEAQATASHTNKTARILTRVTRDGESLQTVVAA